MGSGLVSRGTAARPALRAGRRRCGVPASTLAGCGRTRAAPTCWQPWAGRWHSPSTMATPASSSSSPTRQQATWAGFSGWCAGRPALSGMAPAPRWGHGALHVPWAVPADFSFRSPKSRLHQPRGCPSPITSPNPTGSTSPGVPQSGTQPGRHLWLSNTPAHPCCRAHHRAAQPLAPARLWLFIAWLSPAGASASAWARGRAGGC